MFGSIARNHKNAGVNVRVALCVQLDPNKAEHVQIFEYPSTGLEIHKLAGEGHRELFRQARASALPPREKFENVAWKVAACSLMEKVPTLCTAYPPNVLFAVQLLCFIAEYASKKFQDRETRDVLISATGEVSIESIAGMVSKSTILGNYKK